MPYDVTRNTLDGMTHIPPPAEELRLLDAELWQLDARRAQLLSRRAWLVALLQQPQAQPRTQAHSAPTPAVPPRPEASAPSVQNLLLLLGGVLLTIAAMVFTLVSWGHLGITGRALVLGVVTLAALAGPAVLLRRGLRSTAESVAGLGLALTVLDAYALHEAALAGTDGTGYAAVASAVLAGVWAAYGLPPATAALRLPLPTALTAAQLPLLLWAIAADAGPYGITAALLVTAGADTGVALRTSARSVRVVAAVGAYGTGAWGVLAAGWLCWTANGPGGVARAAALLLLAAAIAMGAAWWNEGEKRTVGLSVTSGLLVVAAFGGVLRSALPEAWTVPAHLACGIALLAVARSGRLPEAVRHGLAWASGSVQALAVLWTVPVLTVTLLGPVGRVAHAWTGAPSDARDAATVGVPWPPHAVAVPVVLVAVAGVLVLAVRDTTWRPRALTGALGLLWATAATLPAVLELPYAVGLSVLGVTVAATLAAEGAVHRATPVRQDTVASGTPSTAPGGTPSPAPDSPAPPVAASRPTATPTSVRNFPPARTTATVLALVASLDLAFLSLATQTATLVVLAALTTLFTAASWRSRLAPVTAPAALAYAAALACATGAAAHWTPAHTALLVLVVPAVAALLAPRLGGSPATMPVEAAGAVAGLLAVALAGTDLPVLALVLALCGVITAGTAVRADRRPLGYAATALFVLATWVRLTSWDVGTPEAYTLPVTVPALLVGMLRRHRDPRASSWTAYGPGLAATLLPSLVAAWGDASWTRPLLLGAAALLVTLLGARHHLQAPLVLGGSVLALVALHELAPYLVQVTGLLPRWALPALVGLLLLALGATYEQRIRDVRRVREVLGRMS
ncbi:SCO7613 C-terminal domain-containing membrane protein [Streptomyces sp. NBC_00076]|uniref:SCO7613 C-terminal domain-containing membrane protein n=1 Tax=Streptomyces sp. NBC_00076 TaxID=2975642 RepID=UPI003253BB50